VAKTSTKEAIAAVLRTARTVLANEGNENNEVGLPLTLLRLRPTTQAAVLEMGMYVEGDIAHLAGLARPQVGVVTAVRGVHLMRAGSLATIEREKGRLVEALPADGTAVLNADDPLVAGMRGRTQAKVMTYGFAAGADVTAGDVIARGVAGMGFRLLGPGLDVAVETPALGRHNVHNALAAAAVGLAAGLPADAIARGLAQPWGAAHRSELLAAGPWLVVDDTYNAGPDSMAAALAVLADLPGRRVAVLGEMLELGDGGPAAHRDVGAAAAGVADLLLTVGDGALEIAAAARAAGLPPGAIVHAADATAATRALLPRLRPGDTILVKGSHDVALEQVVADLEAAGARAEAR
ncbi:MAG TPA: UDP-N-acetylmuramoyl-tripeptide--D-alanyl-D-alanine ligase, partial [Candidatus Sulfotelmatobacter sp.]|nr:UDP-N-acetylmuramoyl-tripeptide--D-alanyl-D-alanine ligase [Candidatus Sulfotelmatobacter sp.]